MPLLPFYYIDPHVASPGIASTPSPEVLNLWKEAQAVCFDVDSTLYVVDILLSQALFSETAYTLPLHRCEDESIDEIAAFLGVGEQVAALTARYGTELLKRMHKHHVLHHSAPWAAASSFRTRWLPAST